MPAFFLCDGYGCGQFEESVGVYVEFYGFAAAGAASYGEVDDVSVVGDGVVVGGDSMLVGGC